MRRSAGARRRSRYTSSAPRWLTPSTRTSVVSSNSDLVAIAIGSSFLPGPRPRREESSSKSAGPVGGPRRSPPCRIHRPLATDALALRRRGGGRVPRGAAARDDPEWRAHDRPSDTRFSILAAPGSSRPPRDGSGQRRSGDDDLPRDRPQRNCPGWERWSTIFRGRSRGTTSRRGALRDRAACCDEQGHERHPGYTHPTSHAAVGWAHGAVARFTVAQTRPT